jgi:uncharacterized protein DUF4149
MKALTGFRLLLLGLWLGAAVFFIAVAQIAFGNLPARDLAGNIVGRTLAVLNYAGIGVALITVLTSLVVPDGVRIIAVWAERILLVILGVACAVSQFVISWWMLMLRTQMGRPIEEVAADDPLRIQFDNLHQYSEWLLMAAMAAALLSFVIVALRSTPAAKKDALNNLDFQKQFKI